MTIESRATKLTAASSSRVDVLAALHAHFGSSGSFFTSTFDDSSGDGTLRVTPKSAGQVWEFILSTIGAATASFYAGSMEPDRASAGSAQDPATDASAHWSGARVRTWTAWTQHLLVLEYRGDGLDTFAVLTYADNAGDPAYPFTSVLTAGRLGTPLGGGLVHLGMDGLGWLSGEGSRSTSTTGTVYEIVNKRTTTGVAASGAVRIAENTWVFPVMSRPANSSQQNAVIGTRRLLAPVIFGVNDAEDGNGGDLLLANHIAYSHQPEAPGARVVDDVAQTAWIAPSAAVTPAARDCLFLRYQYGGGPDPTPGA